MGVIPVLKALKIVLFVLIFQFFHSPLLYPQIKDLQFEHYTVEDGLSSNSVWSIVQDKQGFMWFGTSNGLNRWDGYTFRTFTHNTNDSNSISNNFIWSLHVNISGCIWIGTDNGLNRYDPRTEKFIHYMHNEIDSSSISNNTVHAIFEDHARNIWFGTEKGLDRYNPELDNFKHFFFPGQLDSASFWWNNNTVRAINEDKNGKLLLGTSNDFLIFDPKTKEITTVPYVIPDRKRWPQVLSICKDRLDHFWVGIVNDGVIEFNPETGKVRLYQTKQNDPYSYSSLFSTSICEDRKGQIWMGSPDQGLNIFERSTGHFRHYKPTGGEGQGLNGYTIYSIYEDRQGNMWVGTGDRGINVWLRWKKPFRSYAHDPQNAQSLGQGEITGFYEDKNNRLWVLHSTNGISLLNRHTSNFSHISVDPGNINGLSPGSLYGMYEDKYGDLWFAVTPDINRWNPKTGKFKHYKFSLSNPKSHAFTYTLCCHEDGQGNMWFGTGNAGLEKLNPADETFDRFCYDAADSNSIINNTILSLYLDKAGDFWIGTANGLCQLVYDNAGNEKFIRYQSNPENPSSITGRQIFSLFEDRTGRFWIGTDKALNLFDREQRIFKAFTTEDGLPSNTIMGIVEDGKGPAAGNLWIRTDRGIVKFNPETYQIRVYDEGDGLKDCNSIESGYAAFYKSKNGEIYSGSTNGVVAFYPDSLKDNPDIPHIVLTELKINYEQVRIGPNSPLQRPLNTIDVIKLTHSQNILSFEFAALDYTSPKKNLYAYKLEGINEEWVYTDASRRLATYTNLDPGEYVFRVKGSNNDGVWNEKGTSLRIIITPPFWKASWFRLLVFLMIIGLIYSIYRYRLNRLLELERMRIRIASDLHDDIGSTLTKIAVNSEIIQTTVEKRKVLETSRKIGDMSREIITTLSDVVWSIDTRNDSVGDLIDRMRDFIDTVFPPGSIQIDFQTRGLHFQQKIDQTLRQNIYLIFKEAVNNAAKHSKADIIHIHLTNGEGKFRMEIADNGIGMDLNQDHPGHHGLENMKLRAARIGGDLRIEIQQGTLVTLTAKAI
jgi:ligand-binding sensor domain-containing protein/two-component sensor histidine kinase